MHKHRIGGIHLRTLIFTGLAKQTQLLNPHYLVIGHFHGKYKKMDSTCLIIPQLIEGKRVRIRKVHKESKGYFQKRCTGIIDFVERDSSVWVKFDENQPGVPDNSRSWYVGKLKHLGKKFTIKRANTNVRSAL